jgi:hypothetical protein
VKYLSVEREKPNTNNLEFYIQQNYSSRMKKKWGLFPENKN